ncbi:MAG: hypothetical protein WEB04_08370 [Dehalococcoidia bacterium]
MDRKVIGLALIIALGAAGVLGSTLVLSQGATPATTPTREATAVPTSGPTAAPTSALPPLPGLPDGVSGRLTYFSQGELVTVQLPEGIEVAREPVADMNGSATSPDGSWTATPNCGATACDLVLSGPLAAGATLHIDGLVDGIEWSADGGALAYVTMAFDSTGVIARRDLFIIETDAFDEPRMLLSVPGNVLLPFVWSADGNLVVASNDGAETRIERIDVNGEAETIATAEAQVYYFYPSPDRSTVAYTQDSDEGWRLLALDLDSGDVTDYGNMGSDPAGTAPPVVTPTVKGPMYVAWSPDGTRLAFGGGNEAPYTMTIVDLQSGAPARTAFEEGYPGEIKWSPDGRQVAVSTYDAERTRHEVYIVDPATGVARHVSSGCVIVWSPDGRFLAQHIDKEPGVGIVDVATGQYGHLTNERYDTPLRWEDGTS